MKNFFKKIWEFVKKVWAWLRVDGLLHLLVCDLIALYLTGFVPLWVALVVSLAIGIAYEIYQYFSKKGCAEWHDVFCDAIGVALAALEFGSWALFHLLFK